MKKLIFKLAIAAASLMSFTSCLGLLGSSGVEAEISGDLWVFDSYRMRVSGVYDQTSGYDVYALLVDGDWSPGYMTVQYIRFPEAERSITLTLFGDTDEVSISTENQVIFIYPSLGGPWTVEYDKEKNPDEVNLRMVYTVEGITHNDYIKLIKQKSVKKGQRIKVK